MRRLVTFAAAVAFALAAAPAARAQMADALGKPLPKADLPVGTVTVRVVEGDMAKPLVGADVELRIAGVAELRTARTDASGRATFAGLAPGSKVKATFAGQEKPIESEELTVPAEGGVAVMLSSVPFKDGGGGGPMMGGMPEPRTMAGQPRPEQADPGGKITVRLSYNDLTKTDGIADRPVVCV